MKKLMLLTMAIVSFTTFAQKTDYLYTYTIKGSIEANKKTFYSKFIQDFAKDQSGQVIKNYPYKRSIYYFLKDKSSCLFPASKELFKDHSEDLVFSDSILGIDLNLVSLDKKNMAATVDDIKGKIIVSLNQIFVPEVVKKHAKSIVEVEKEDQAVKMLSAKRADYLLAPGYDIVKSYEVEGVNLYYNSELVVDTFYDRIVCHNIGKNKKRVSVFNQLIR